MKKRLVVLSTFDGIAACQVALHRAGITNYVIYSSEIDPDAKKVIMARWPDTIDIGDIRFLKPSDFKHVDVIFGGSPCQDMSRMGKLNGISTKLGIAIRSLDVYMAFKNRAIEEGRNLNEVFNPSALFWEFVRMYEGIKKYNPNLLFLIENVNNPYWEKIITKALGVEPITINSSLISAQNRERNYWTNIPYTPITDLRITLDMVITDAITGVGVRGRKLKGDEHYSYPRTVRKDFKANCLVTKIDRTGRYLHKDGKDYVISPEEAEALQTLPRGYTYVDGLSKNKRYRLIGNSWTVDVLVHFFQNIPVALDITLNPMLK